MLLMEPHGQLRDPFNEELRRRHRELLKLAAEARLAAQARPARRGMLSAALRGLGRGLVRLGAALLRHECDELAFTAELLSPAVRRARLN